MMRSEENWGEPLKDDAQARIRELEDALMLMVYQYCQSDGRLEHAYMCAGEHAFKALGLKNGDRIEVLEAMMDESSSERRD